MSPSPLPLRVHVLGGCGLQMVALSPSADTVPGIGKVTVMTERSFTLGLDLDGVCADFIHGFRPHVAAATGASMHELGPLWTWDVTTAWPAVGSMQQFMDIHADATRAGLYATLPVIAHAPKMLRSLASNGVHVRVITHRLSDPELAPRITADTMHWLNRNRIPYSDISFTGNKAQVEADVYVDDAPANIKALTAAGKTLIIFDQPYNRHFDGLRARDWVQAAEMVSELQDAWTVQRAA